MYVAVENKYVIVTLNTSIDELDQWQYLTNCESTAPLTQQWSSCNMSVLVLWLEKG